MNISSAALRKSGGISGGEFTGQEGVDARNLGSVMATEHAAHVTGNNKTEQEVISSRPPIGKKGARGVRGSD
jgi:hypothetical protein